MPEFLTPYEEDPQHKRWHMVECRHCGVQFVDTHPESEFCICSGLGIFDYVPEEVYYKYFDAWFFHVTQEK